MKLYATPQAADTLTIGDEVLYVHGFEVNDSLRKQMELTEDKHGNGYSRTSTANHRGFIATLEVKDHKLFLNKLTIRVHSEERSNAIHELSNMNRKNPSKADKKKIEDLIHIMRNSGVATVPIDYLKNDGYAYWFSGKLYHYYGEPLSYKYTHKLSKARVLTFTAGILISEKHIKIEDKRGSQVRDSIPTE